MFLIVLAVFLFLIILGLASPERTGKTEKAGETVSEECSVAQASRFMNKKDTGFIKGIAIIMIMLSHIAIKLGDSLVIGGVCSMLLHIGY